MNSYVFVRHDIERVFARSEEEALAELAERHPHDEDWELVDVEEHDAPSDAEAAR